MTVSDIPLVSFFRRLVDPLIILTSLYFFTLVGGEPFKPYYVLLMIVTFFISCHIYTEVNPYRAWHEGNFWAYARDVFVGWSIIIIILLLIGRVTGFNHEYEVKIILPWFVFTPFLLLASHFFVRQMIAKQFKEGEVRSAIIVGGNEVGLELAERIARCPYLLMDMRGFFDDRAESRHSLTPQAPMLGKIEEVADYVREHNIKIIFISLPMSAQPRISKLLEELQDSTTSIYFVPDIYIFDLMAARFDDVGGMPVVAVCETPFMGLNSIVKRASDVVLASLFLIMLLPIFLGVACAVKLSSRGPILFKQRRYGLNGEEISVYKFRSMTVCEDGPDIAQAKKDDVRVTKLGAFLRRSSLDELPQFFNVLQGRMSIVGPRPHAVAHNEMYRKLIKGYMLRHKVKPGITGWAQVNGFRGETDTLDKMESRIDYDLEYLRNWSLWLDLRIIFLTVWVILRRKNAY